MKRKTRDWFTVLLVLCSPAMVAAENDTFGFGVPLSATEISAIDTTVMPDGRGLPAGSGSYVEGKAIYLQQCVSCHGEKLEGVKKSGGPLIGGRDTLTSKQPKKTIESYWPTATTLFDYMKRAMPFNEPGSLSNSELYALCAYILTEGKVIDQKTVLDAKSLAAVKMPNKEGFFVRSDSESKRTAYQ